MSKEYAVDDKYISRIKTGFLVDKIGSHLKASFHDEALLDNLSSIRKQMDIEESSLDFVISPKGRMQVFEEIGDSHYETDEEIERAFRKGVSGIHFRVNKCGEALAKKECLNHFISYISNSLSINEYRLKNMRRGLPLFLMSKKRREDFKRLSKKVDIMRSISSGDNKTIEQYSPLQDVHRLDLDKELRVITPFLEDDELFLVDLKTVSITPVKPVMSGFEALLLIMIILTAIWSLTLLIAKAMYVLIIWFRILLILRVTRFS